MKYLVMEIQTFDAGTVATPTYSFDNRMTAERQYHLLIAGAVVSQLPIHAVVMMTNDGRIIESKYYRHEPEPEPTPEPETPEEEPSGE
jgi:hypothetical protein